MNKSKNLSVNDAYDLFIRKCRVKNLSQASIVSYENKIHPFVDYCDGGLISAVTIDTVDGFTNHLKTEHNVNDVSAVSYLRSVRAFLYYCMECNYMTTFKIHLPKAQKDIKETYSNEQLEKLLAKPDLNSCSFTEFKTMNTLIPSPIWETVRSSMPIKRKYRTAYLKSIRRSGKRKRLHRVARTAAVRHSRTVQRMNHSELSQGRKAGRQAHPYLTAEKSNCSRCNGSRDYKKLNRNGGAKQ